MVELYDAMGSLRAVRRLKPDPIPEQFLRANDFAVSVVSKRRGLAPGEGLRRPQSIKCVPV